MDCQEINFTKATCCFYSFLFYAEAARPAKIWRCNLDASDCSVIRNSSLSRPTGLVLDFGAEKLCFGDMLLGFIACMDYDGGNFKNLAVNPRPFPSSLAILDGTVMFQI